MAGELLLLVGRSPRLSSEEALELARPAGPPWTCCRRVGVGGWDGGDGIQQRLLLLDGRIIATVPMLALLSNGSPPLASSMLIARPIRPGQVAVVAEFVGLPRLHL